MTASFGLVGLSAVTPLPPADVCALRTSVDVAEVQTTEVGQYEHLAFEDSTLIWEEDEDGLDQIIERNVGDGGW